MFQSLALDGLWLLGSLAFAFLAGVVMSQKVKDSLNGVPAATRNALKQVEVVALSSLHEAQAKVVTDITGALAPKAPAAPVAPAAPKPATGQVAAAAVSDEGP